MKFKRFVSGLLCAIILVGILPTTSFAADGWEELLGEKLNNEAVFTVDSGWKLFGFIGWMNNKYGLGFDKDDVVAMDVLGSSERSGALNRRVSLAYADNVYNVGTAPSDARESSGTLVGAYQGIDLAYYDICTGVPSPFEQYSIVYLEGGEYKLNSNESSQHYSEFWGQYISDGYDLIAKAIMEQHPEVTNMSSSELLELVAALDIRFTYVYSSSGEGNTNLEKGAYLYTKLSTLLSRGIFTDKAGDIIEGVSGIADWDKDAPAQSDEERIRIALAKTLYDEFMDCTNSASFGISQSISKVLSNDNQVALMLRTLEEQRIAQAAGEVDFVLDEPYTGDIYEALRLVGMNYIQVREGAGGTLSVSEYFSSVTEASFSDDDMKDAFSKALVLYNASSSIALDSPPNTTDLSVLYGWACFHPDIVKGDPSGWELNNGELGDRNTYESYVLPAREQLASLMASDPDAFMSTDAIDMSQLWVPRFWVAYGVAVGVLPREDLSLVTSTQSTIGTFMSALPPVELFVHTDPDDANHETTNVYDPVGALKLISVVNELPYITNGLVNFLLNRLSDGSSGGYSFVGLQDKLLGIREMYEAFTALDDATMWSFWESTAFDESESSEKRSMRMIYEVLLANNVFDRTDVESEPDAEQAFTFFFDHQTSELSSWIRTGIATSAQFIPMHTNVYDPYTWKDSVDTGWLLNFYAKFGYFRKALYIDTASEAASNYANTRGKGTTRVATLDDLLQEKDIVLYIDPNLYNVDEIADLMGKAWDRLGQDEASNSLGVFDSIGAAITNLWDVSMPELAKSGGTTSYSSRVDFTGETEDDSKWSQTFFHHDGAAKLSTYEDVNAQTSIDPNSRNVADYLYRDDIYDPNAGALKDGYQAVEYTPLFGYAVLSAVYNQKASPGLLQALNSLSSSNNPVFIASDTIPYTHEEYRSVIYNWALLRNLDAQMTTDYATSLDRTSPLYMDVFGNILTESGYVVVPAAANASLYEVQDYQPRTAAFCSTYGDSYFIPYYDTEAASGLNNYLSGDSDYAMFSVDEENGVFVLRTVYTVDGTVDLSRVSIADKTSLQALTDTFEFDLRDKVFYKFSLFELIITEALRGAPIEYIDKQFEGIQTNVTYTRQGLIVADKLETLVDAIAPAGQNASVAIPNPAYIDGLEYIVFFLYKILILAVLVLWMVTIYFDATRGAIGIKTAGRCIGIVVLVIAMVVGIPRIFEITYYESNKLLLQNETEYLMMLNLEKQANGEEIGVSKVDVPDPRTKLYLYLADVEMPWWDLFTSVTVSSSIKSLDELYTSYENQHPLAFVDDATVMNGRIYIDTDTLFESAKVSFSPVLQSIYVTGTEDTPASYYTPYYYFLDTITKEISAWSNRENFIAYTTKTQRGGELKTLGYCQAFFNDADFLEEGSDFFNLYEVYNAPAPRTYEHLPELSTEDLDNLRNSQWCNTNISAEGKIARIEKLNQFAQEWIANNRGMIGRVSDETFLKCFSLACAMEHNRLFNTQRADYLEIQELSNEDLLRLTIADHNDVMANSSMSYARFVYTQGGTMAVYVAAILEIVNFIGSWVKPAVTLAVFLIACISIFVLKLLLNRGNNSIYGYVVTIVLMCSVNILGALFIKLSMFIPTLGFTPTVCMLLQILVQIGYIFLQIKIVTIALSDWKNIGFSKHESMFMRMNPMTRRHNVSREVGVTPGTSGHDYLDALLKQQAKRRMRA